MREPGIPKLLSWRWAPCAALVLGAFSFCAFALLAIPDHIAGLEEGTSNTNLRLGNQLSRIQATPPVPGELSNEASSASEDDDESSGASTVTQLAARASGGFPKRGFTPPLDRPEPPPAAPAPPPPPPPPPAAEAPAPPPPAEAPAEAAQPQPESGAPDAPAEAPPAPQ